MPRSLDQCSLRVSTHRPAQRLPPAADQALAQGPELLRQSGVACLGRGGGFLHVVQVERVAALQRRRGARLQHLCGALLRALEERAHQRRDDPPHRRPLDVGEDAGADNAGADSVGGDPPAGGVQAALQLRRVQHIAELGARVGVVPCPGPASQAQLSAWVGLDREAALVVRAAGHVDHARAWLQAGQQQVGQQEGAQVVGPQVAVVLGARPVARTAHHAGVVHQQLEAAARSRVALHLGGKRAHAGGVREVHLRAVAAARVAPAV
mmetsp:Transcript_47825/g.122039  ORF Transcript_47825/g.122039 Transcript_47825/m.122039 type:complete len:266 (+) Transcript_47825:338-1135(+)